MIELSLNESTANQLKKVAEAKGSTTGELAEQAIRQFLREEKRRMMQRESDAFRQMHSDLLKRYAGEFVAIYQGQLVDHDANQAMLVIRIDQRFPDVPVWIAPVLLQPEEVYTVYSPGLEYGR